MNRDVQYILGLVAAEEYRNFRQNVFRPGSFPLAESVFWFEENKNQAAENGEAVPSPEEIERYCGDEIFAKAIGEAFGAYRIPVSETTVEQTLEAMRMFEELEEISDDVCARFLREGIAPTLENLHTLRFEKEGPLPAAGGHLKEGEQALAWTFPGEDPAEDEDILRRAGMEDDEFGRRMIAWCRDRRIYISETNLNLLKDLWTVPLPFEPADAALFAAKNLRRGIKPREGLIIESVEMNQQDQKHKQAQTSGPAGPEETHLRLMEELFERYYIGLYDKERYLDYEFEEYRKCLATAAKTEEILCKYDLPVSADNLTSFAGLLNPEGIFPLLGRLLTEKKLLALYEGSPMDAPHCEKVLNALWESFEGRTFPETSDGLEEIGNYITAQKTLMLMQKLEEKGFFEVPVKEEDTLLRLRVRREKEGGFTAVTEEESIGGLSLRYRKTGEGISLLAVGSREETLQELKERTKDKVALTTLYSPEFPYGRNFY